VTHRVKLVEVQVGVTSYVGVIRRIAERVKEIIKAHELDTLRAKHKVGEVIFRELRKVPWGDRLRILENVAREVGWSARELYRCAQFYELYPDLDKFLGRNPNVTWRKVVMEYLPQEKRGPKPWTCPACGSEYGGDVKPTTVKLCPFCWSEFLAWKQEHEGGVQE